jgi:hypothetical protein
MAISMLSGSTLASRNWKVAVFRGFDGGDVAGQVSELPSRTLASGFSKKPPVVTVASAVVLVTLRLHPLHHPLENCREPLAHLVGVQAEQVDDQRVAGRRHQVTAVAVLTDVALQPRHGAQAQRGGFFAADDEAGAVQLDTPVADSSMFETSGLALADVRRPNRRSACRKPRRFDQAHRHLAASPLRRPSPSAGARAGLRQAQPEFWVGPTPTVMAMRTAAPLALSTHG